MEPIVGSFWLALRLIAPGWIWTVATDAPVRETGFDAFLPRLGRAVVVGLLLNLLPILALASFHAWTPLWDWTLWLSIVVAGVIWAHMRGWRTGPSAARFAAALALIGLVTGVPLLQPPRSEWLAGGWDPGIYQNNAVAIARDNGLQGRPDSIYSLMTEGERELFTRSDGEYHEIFPGAPVRVADGSLPLYFFHLTPLCGAWFLRMGGMGLLHRMPSILALWGLLPMLALCGFVGMGGWRKGVVLLLWLLSPMWWYQQAIPTSEMLYLLLLVGAALLYLRAVARRSRVPLGALGALFAATVNHLNAAVLIGILLVVAAWAEADARAPGRVARTMLGFAAIGLAIAWDLKFAGITILRLEEKDQVLRVILPVFSSSALLAALLAIRPLPSAIRTWGLRLAAAGGALAGFALAGLALGAGVEPVRSLLMKGADHLPWAGPAIQRLIRVVPFHGSLGFAWAGAGLAWLSLRRDPALRAGKVLMAALGIVCLLLFLQLGITPLYPWALRRYVVFLVPLLAWAQAFAVVRVGEIVRAHGGGWRWAVLFAFLPALVQSGRLSAAALRVGDYAGLGRVLAGLEKAIESGDVIVADDPEWGTPLLLAGGREVVSGRRLWRNADPVYQRQYMEALQRVRQGGRRLLWLTSTGDGRDLYPVELGGSATPIVEIPFAFQTINHGLRARTYETKARQRLFRLYEWDGSFHFRGDPAAGAALP